MTSVTKQARSRLQRWACDRCYKLKERCTRQSATGICGRCNRLGLSCTTIRPPRPMGRRPKKEPRHRIPDHSDAQNSDSSGPTPAASLSLSLSLSSSSSNLPGGGGDPASLPPLQIGEWINGLADLRQGEKEKLLFLLDRPENLNYVVIPSFQDAARRSLAAPLPAALPVLKDAYLACAGALKLTQAQDPDRATVATEEGHANLLHALAAMKTLRALTVSTPQDAALCLTLGISLTLFVYSVVGHGAYEICRHCLSMAKPFAERELLDLDTEPWLTFLVLLEIIECLIHRRRPTIRSPWRRRTLDSGRDSPVDRHLGLCAPLLPYYHDLCVASHSLANTTDVSYIALIEKQLGQIQVDLEAWQPHEPDGFLEKYQPVEVIHLLAQARLYRLAALLVSHRLRCAFGEEDDRAEIWAKEIMNELELARRITKRSPRCVTLPFVTAAIEMRDLAGRRLALQNVDEYVDQFAPVVQKAIKTFLSRVWWGRDHQVTKSWFDSTHKPCVVLASIDTALFGG